MFRPILTHILLASLLCLSLATAAEEVGPKDKLRFDQDKATAYMRELEERMYRLGELLREQQPDDSARLLMAFRTAREQLIVDQMRDVNDLLAKMDLGQATDEQKQVIRKLEELKELLLSKHLDLAFRLDQLRKLTAAQESLRKLIEKETRQHELSGEAAKKADASASESLRDQEERNRRVADDLAKSLEAAGANAKAAAENIGQAGGSMGAASGKLGEGKPGEACPSQAEAVEKLRKAQEQLEEARKKLQEEMEPLVRARVIENLTEMLSQQRKVREATERSGDKAAQGQRPAILAIQRLAVTEDQIAELAGQTIDLVVETQFSYALPPALGNARDRMVSVSGELRQGYGSESVIASERSIEADLEALLDAMKAAAKYAKAGEAGQCKSCDSKLNKLLAEVKMLRWMQASVNDQTKKVDDEIKASQPPAPALVERAKQLHQEEEKIRKAMSQLHERTCPDCFNGAFQ